MDVYLAGLQGRRWCVDLYLAGKCYDEVTRYGAVGRNQSRIDLPILESFFYADEWTERAIPYIDKFLLDSGAFTFMTSSSSYVDWDEYVDSYIAFIKRNHVEHYFELDIDSVIGYKAVKDIRKKLEDGTGRKCIPVWHISRGIDEFVRMCEDYEYVAVGGLVGGMEWPRSKWKAFPWFIKTAHQHGAKIHALGFTSLEGLYKYHFDSVDSTAWTTGNRYGFLYRFDGRTMRKIDPPPGKRMVNPQEVAINNFNEWAKFQVWAKEHL